MLASANLWACRSLRFTPRGIALFSTVPYTGIIMLYCKCPLSQHFLRSLQVQVAKLTLPTSPYYRLPVVACLLFYFLLIICFCFFFIVCKLVCLCVQLINLRQGIAACGTPSALCWSPITEGACVFCWTWLTWPRTISQPYGCVNHARLAVEAWGTRSAWCQVPRPLIWWVIWLVGSIRALLALPCTVSPTKALCVVLFLCRHSWTLMPLIWNILNVWNDYSAVRGPKLLHLWNGLERFGVKM